MRLDEDCIRDILLAVEEKTGYQQPTFAEEIAEKLPQYPKDTVLYHINQCSLYGYFSDYHQYVNGDDNAYIADLSPKGHEFLRDIRSQTVWTATKEKLKPFASVSISIIEKVAASIITNQLGI